MAEESGLHAYKLSLMGSGISVEKEIDQRMALAVLQLVLGNGEPRAGAQTTPVGQHDAADTYRRPDQRLSLREVLEASGAKTIPEKIVTIGIFLRDYAGQATFSKEDNKSKFKTAGDAAPANFPRDFSKAIRAGWIAEDHQNGGQFYVTRKGEEVFGRQFEGATAPAPRPRRRREVVETRTANEEDADNG